MASRTRRNRKPELNVEIVAESSDENSPTSTQSSPCRPNNGPTSPNNKFLDARCTSNVAPSWVAMFRIQLTDDIDKKLDEKIHLLEGNLDQRFSDLELKIGDVKQRHEHALQRIKDNETLVGETRNEVSKMRDDLAGMTKAVKSLANEMEDLRNRGIRKTLIFHGFPESKKSFESWDDCKNMIEKYLSICGLKNCNIDRAHRVERKQSNTLSPRPIYAEFTSWQNANRVLSNANTISIFYFFISILSFLPMVAPQSRTALQGAMLKYTKKKEKNIFNQSNVKNRINNLITIAKINFI